MSDTEFDIRANTGNLTGSRISGPFSLAHLECLDKVLEVGEGAGSLVGLDLPAGTEVSKGWVATHVLKPLFLKRLYDYNC